MTAIRHLTASAIVFDDHEQVLLVHHNKLGQWLYPGGHIDPNEDIAGLDTPPELPALVQQAAQWAKTRW